MADQQSTIPEMVKAFTAEAAADGLKPPFIICLINPDGAVLAVRSNPDGGDAEVLVHRDVGHGAGRTSVAVLLDQQGQQRTWTINKPALS